MPSSRSIDITAGAEDDIQAIIYYTLANRGPDQSDRFANGLSAFFDRLAGFPEIGKLREQLLPGARSHPFGSYVVIYVV